MTFAPITWAQLWPIVLIGFGLTYIVTGSTIGYYVRLLWCFSLQWTSFTRYWWSVATCPPCNAFWSGALIGWLTTGSLVLTTQGAVVSCGFVGLVQKLFGGNGIAPYDEDFDEILGLVPSSRDGD